jgi:phage regulator Rha-like protein
MTTLDIFTYDGTLVISSETIADGSGVQHKNVLDLLDANRADFEDFGRVAFETRPLETAGGIQYRRVALLNEQQATLLMTFQRNTDQVREFKKALVRAFFELARSTAPALTDDQIVQQALTIMVAKNSALESKVAELEPSATAWAELASAEGDYEVADAAKILARAGVSTGQMRLFGQLQSMKWIYRGSHGKWVAYQGPVDSGYLTEKPTYHFHPKTGEKVIDPPQVRVTVKGLDRLRIRLGTLDLAATG